MRLISLAALLAIGFITTAQAQIGPNMTTDEFINALETQSARLEMQRRADDLNQRMDELESRQERLDGTGYRQHPLRGGW